MASGTGKISQNNQIPATNLTKANKKPKKQSFFSKFKTSIPVIVGTKLHNKDKLYDSFLISDLQQTKDHEVAVIKTSDARQKLLHAKNQTANAKADVANASSQIENIKTKLNKANKQLNHAKKELKQAKNKKDESAARNKINAAKTVKTDVAQTLKENQQNYQRMQNKRDKKIKEEKKLENDLHKAQKNVDSKHNKLQKAIKKYEKNTELTEKQQKKASEAAEKQEQKDQIKQQKHIENTNKRYAKIDKKQEDKNKKRSKLTTTDISSPSNFTHTDSSNDAVLKVVAIQDRVQSVPTEDIDDAPIYQNLPVNTAPAPAKTPTNFQWVVSLASTFFNAETLKALEDSIIKPINQAKVKSEYADIEQKAKEKKANTESLAQNAVNGKFSDIKCYKNTKAGKNIPYHANNVTIDGKIYVAAQGPDNNTMGDFADLLVASNSPVSTALVATADLTVNSSNKKNARFETGVIPNNTTKNNNVVEFIESFTLPDFKIKVTNLKINGKDHVRIDYEGWEDHTAGSDEKTVALAYTLVKLGIKNPVVNCNAGVGRTGTLISVMAIMENHLQGKKSNVKEIVSQGRDGRDKFVQKHEQYQSLHKINENIESLLGTLEKTFSSSENKEMINPLYRKIRLK